MEGENSQWVGIAEPDRAITKSDEYKSFIELNSYAPTPPIAPSSLEQYINPASVPMLIWVALFVALIACGWLAARSFERKDQPRRWMVLVFAGLAVSALAWVSHPWTLSQCLMDASKRPTAQGVYTARQACRMMFTGEAIN